MNPKTIINKKIRAILKLHLVWLLILLYISLFASFCFSIDVREGDNEVTITWIRPTKNEDGTPLNDLEGYYIYRREATSDTFNRLNEEPVRGICYTDNTPINGITYSYAVTAVDYSGNESKKSQEIDATPNIRPPSRFKVKPGDGEVQLFWEPYEKSEIRGYYVYRKTSNPLEKKTFLRLTKIPIQDNHFTDTNVANGIPYFYKISCVGIDGIEGLHSPEEGATPLALIPEEPSSVRARYIQEANGINLVILTWEESKENNIVGYRVYRRLLNEREFTPLTQSHIHETEYIDTSALPDKGYLYSVVAVTERGMESQYPKDAKCFTSALYISSFTMDTGGKAKRAGDKICFCLRGEPGLLATYKIEGLTSLMPMEETGEGIYNACLDITEEMSVEEGKASAFLEDSRGNKTFKDNDQILTIDNQPPNIVKNAEAEWDTGIVKITWEPPEGEFNGFEIFRHEEGILKAPQVNSSERSSIMTISGDKTFCYDTSIKPDRTYNYSICTLDRAGNKSDPFHLSPVYIPYQSGIPFIKSIQENTAGMPQKTGDRIEVELIGEEGCQASFLIPGIIEEPIPLKEKAFGQYLGHYIVRPEDQSEQAFIKACLKDDLGHISCQNVASGLIINCKLEDVNPPVIYNINHNAFNITGFSGKLVPGNILEVTLEGEVGCKAYFIISSSNISPDSDKNEFDKHELTENPDNPGNYTGVYTIGWEDESMEEAYVWGCMSDRAGNKVWKHSEESLALDIRPRIKVNIPEENKILWADKESQTSVTVNVTDANDEPVEGHLIALTITTTGEYTGVVEGGKFGRQIGTDIGLDFDHTTDYSGEVETLYTSGKAAKTAIIVAKDLTTGHAGAGYVLNFIKAQTDIELLPPPSLAKLLKPKTYKLILTADPDRLTADGVSTSWITAQLTDRDGRPVEKAGVLISFSPEYHSDEIQNGRISSHQVYTDNFGQASTRFIAGIIRGTVIITGSCPEAESGSVTISLMSDAPAKMDLSAEPNHLVANGRSQSTIKVWVADINENPVQEAMVKFSVYIPDDREHARGRLSSVTEATDFNGEAECTYTTPDLYGQAPITATILAEVISKVPTEEELARAVGTIFVPLLYPEMEEEDEVKILEWLSRKGDEIEQGAPIVRIETQKGESILNAPVSGELVKITMHRGERVTLGETIGQILADEEYWEDD